MATRTKFSISKSLADKYSLSTNEAQKLVGVFFDVITENLVLNGKCNISNFISLKVKKKKPRIGINFKDKTKIVIPTSNGLQSRFSSQIKLNGKSNP